MLTSERDGNQVRPSLVILDDPQTDESARSLFQTSECLRDHQRRDSRTGRPRHRTAIIIPCTVIRARRPGGQAAGPADESPLARRADEDGLPVPRQRETVGRLREDPRGVPRADGDGREATEFYRHHREEMDYGPLWPGRSGSIPTMISAVQHAMNLRFTNEQSFFAEYQNEPMASELAEEEQLTATQVAERTNGATRRDSDAGERT